MPSQLGYPQGIPCIPWCNPCELHVCLLFHRCLTCVFLLCSLCPPPWGPTSYVLHFPVVFLKTSKAAANSRPQVLWNQCPAEG